MGLAFHPHEPVCVASVITGEVYVYKYTESGEAFTTLTGHVDSCRDVKFTSSGEYLFTGSKDKKICCYDKEMKLSWAKEESHANAINVLYSFPHDEKLLASADEEGNLKLWDIRSNDRKEISSTKDNQDFISNMTYFEPKNRLITVGGDGFLGAYDLRKSGLKLEKLSDQQEDELLSIAVVKNGRKVVVGTQEGIIDIWSWGEWEDMSDRFPGHPKSVDCILKVDEDTICTGSSDGIIRFVSIFPNKLLGMAGDHDGFPIESMQFSHDRNLIGTSSHDSIVRFFDVSYLNEPDSDEEEGELNAKAEDSVTNETTSNTVATASNASNILSNTTRPKKKMKAATKKEATQDFFSDL